ncbi:MAG: phosphoglucosamine mutase [Chitinophagaceae bacterium]|nr:MAG: phosphoglucosamine mutase [Chitinophagaceae bacterium]
MTLITSISGIRGIVGGKPGEGLTPPDIIKFTTAYAYWINKQGNDSKKIIIGRDARITGEMVTNLVSGTLMAMGYDVYDLGLSTTPTVELAVMHEKAAGGLILTASHNPKPWNALKLLNHKGEFLNAKEGKEILEFAESEDILYSEAKQVGKYHLLEGYIEKHIALILDIPHVKKDLIKEKNYTIVVDSVNSTGGISIPVLLEHLGVKKVISLYGEPTGDFPHNPEPLPENLSTLASEVKKQNADLGIAVDPDVDRLVLVSDDGSMFGEEYTLVAVADYILGKEKGNTVSNMSSTRSLKEVTESHGGEYFPSAVGEVNVVEKMKEVNAVIGGEGNGGVIYPPLHYGRDALVGIALFLSHLAESGKRSSTLRKSYPNYHISKNKIALTAEVNMDKVFEELKKKYKKYPLNTEDGLKIQFDDDWIHLRKSNTEPIIRIYTESANENTAESMAKKIMDDIRNITENN